MTAPTCTTRLPAPDTNTEIYDPATQTWTGGRAGLRPTLTALPDGTALMVDGSDGMTGVQDTAELYDSASGTWSLTNEPFTGRFGHRARARFERAKPDWSSIIACGLTSA